ncbi:MAG: T9SS type A sorting domain-containing protein [Bacteroidales bacterium]|nr:T9SS type A sorting domain-containing protein [Bacteroidales bacterium]
MMKQILILLIQILISAQIFAQVTQSQAYEAENVGYFITPAETPYGIVFTDNLASRIYLLNKGEVKTLVESPGCGRYFNIPEDRKYIFYKSINNKGEQAPAYFDLEQNKNIILLEYAKLYSQPSIANNGDIFIIRSQSSNISFLKFNISNPKNQYTLSGNQYANLTPVSPDAQYAVYDVNQDYFVLLNLKTEEEVKLPNDGTGVIYPKWSPDSKKILYQSRNTELFVYELETKNIYKIGKGGAGSWDENSNDIIFQRTEANPMTFEFISSELFISDYKGENIRQITNTEEIFEMTPSFASDGNILYQTYDKRQIIKAKLDKTKSEIVSKQIMLDNPKEIKPKFYNQDFFLRNNKDAVHLEKDVPYIHQVYDAPTGRNGDAACAPTTSVMALAYYNRLPQWPVEALNFPDTVPPNHKSLYSGYILDRYRYNNFYLDAYSVSKNAYGGYAYMWVDPYDSPGQEGMYNFQELHKMVSTGYVWLGNCTFENTISEINNQYPHPICSWITASGHLTLAVGYFLEEHIVIFNDPYGNKNFGYPNYNGKDSYYDWPGWNNGFQNLDPDGSHGTVAWTLTARSEEPEYNNLNIDDIYYNHGFYMYNDESLQKYYRSVYTDAGQNGHLWWTVGMGGVDDECYVTWTPNIPADDLYNIKAYIPDEFSDDYDTYNREITNSAFYKVFFEGGNTVVTINQKINQGTWVDLGTYNFTQTGNYYVYLGDSVSVSDDGKKVLFDAVKFEQGNSNQLINQKIIEIYPNPSDGKILIQGLNKISSSDVFIEISNLSGKVIEQLKVKSPGIITNIDLSSYSKGIYFVKVYSSTYNFSKKIILK